MPTYLTISFSPSVYIHYGQTKTTDKIHPSLSLPQTWASGQQLLHRKVFKTHTKSSSFRPAKPKNFQFSFKNNNNFLFHCFIYMYVVQNIPNFIKFM